MQQPSVASDDSPDIRHQPTADEVRDHDTVAFLADGLSPVAPPPALRSSLLQQIASLPQDGAAAPGELTRSTVADDIRTDAPARAGSPWRRRFFALAAGLALIVGAGVATTTVVSQLQRPASVVALDEIRSAPDAEQAEVRLDPGATTTALLDQPMGAGDVIAVTIEQAGGSPSGSPTTDPVIVIPTA